MMRIMPYTIHLEHKKILTFQKKIERNNILSKCKVKKSIAVGDRFTAQTFKYSAQMKES